MEDNMPWRRYAHVDPRRHLAHLTAKLGRRGTFLALLGAVWVSQGVSVLVAPDSPTYMLLAHGAEWRAIAWITTGAVAIMAASRRQGYDAVGFLALYTMAAYRAVAYGSGAVLWVMPGGNDGNPRGVVGLLSWLVIIAAILTVAGWPEPEDRRRGTD